MNTVPTTLKRTREVMPEPVAWLFCLSTSGSDPACVLSENEKAVIRRCVVSLCKKREWTLKALTCHSDQLQLVVEAFGREPMKVLNEIRSYCEATLDENSSRERNSWWSTQGTVFWIFDDTGLESVTQYVCTQQESVGMS